MVFKHFIIQLDEMSLLLKDRMGMLSATCHGVPCIMLNKLTATMYHTMLLLRFHSYTFHEMVLGTGCISMHLLLPITLNLVFMPD